MRNFFRKYRKKNIPLTMSDAQPRGIHHTVKFDVHYNDTWNHIWKEIKNIGLSNDENKCFVNHVIYSYAEEIPLKKNCVPVIECQKCERISYTKVLPQSFMAKRKIQEGKATKNNYLPEDKAPERQCGIQKEDPESRLMKLVEAFQFMMTATEYLVYRPDAFNNVYDSNRWNSTLNATIVFAVSEVESMKADELHYPSISVDAHTSLDKHTIIDQEKTNLSGLKQDHIPHHSENISQEKSKERILQKRDHQDEFERKISLQYTGLAYISSDQTFDQSCVPIVKNINLLKFDATHKKLGKHLKVSNI